MKLTISTPDGTFVATYSPRGLVSLDFPAKSNAAREDAPPSAVLLRRTGRPPQVSKSVRAWHALTRGALLATLAGKAVRELPPLDWTAATDFQRKVWTALLKIPAGQTRSYHDIAHSIGKPKGTRAVGNACGDNPIPVLVPCHRVLAKSGRLGGFSAGLAWKRLLLARESTGEIFLDRLPSA